MPLPASVPTGTVSGTWYTPSGSLAVGEIIFLLQHEIEIPDDPDGVVIPVRHEVTVSAGQLNATLPAGFYNTLVRLSELYFKPKVVEVVAGQNLNLPDAIGVVPPKELLTPVRTVNGVGPDSSGNIQIETGGGSGAVDSVFGRTGVVVAQSGDYTKAQVGLSNVDNTTDLGKPVSTATQTALDGKAALVHTHTISNVTGLQTALDNKEASGTASAAVSAHVALPDPHTQYALEASLSTVATTGAYADLTGKPAIPARTKVRHEYIKSGNVTLPNSAGSWARPGGTNGLPADFELAIPAVVGDWVECSYNGMKTDTSSAFLDVGVVVGTTIVRFLGSGDGTGLVEGDPGWYPVTGFRPHAGVRGFVVEAGDLDSGNIRFAVVNKTAGSGTLFASNDYPFYWHVKNNGPVD